jgi:cytochrome c
VAACAGVCAGTASAAHAQDASRGRELYEARCGACHSIEADRVGPRHAGVFGRRAGSVRGFDYSPALAASNVVWNAATLERWLADPEALIPGQRMNYRVAEARDRADLVAFLRGAK